MRIVLCGSRSFGAQVLADVTTAGHDVAAVAAPVWRDPSSPGGHHDLLWARATDAGLPVIDAAAFTAASVPDDVDLIVAAHAHNFISRAALDRTRLGGIGYHPSLLPRHRGRDAIRWTVAMGDAVTGGSVYWLTSGVDAGPLAAQRHIMVRPGETRQELWRRLFPLGRELLTLTLADLAAGVVRRVPQDEEAATWEPSWEREPLHRPDLIAIGPMPRGFEVVGELS